MRGKAAKQLRRIAQGQTIGSPGLSYSELSSGTRILFPHCTRAFYQRLKKARRAVLRQRKQGRRNG